MATVSYEAVYGGIQSAIAAISAGGPITITHAGTGYGTDFRITKGAAVYQVHLVPLLDYYTSNVRYPRLEVTVMFHHYRNSLTNERNFSHKTLYYIADSLLDHSTWEAMAGVYALEPDTEPEISEGSREGNVITFELTATVLLDAA
jgi:hypothetical protein